MVADKEPWEYMNSAEGTASRKILGKCLFTYSSNPQNKWYEDYPLSIWEEDPSSPNDDEIAEQHLRRA